MFSLTILGHRFERFFNFPFPFTVHHWPAASDWPYAPYYCLPYDITSYHLVVFKRICASNTICPLSVCNNTEEQCMQMCRQRHSKLLSNVSHKSWLQQNFEKHSSPSRFRCIFCINGYGYAHRTHNNNTIDGLCRPHTHYSHIPCATMPTFTFYLDANRAYVERHSKSKLESWIMASSGTSIHNFTCMWERTRLGDRLDVLNSLSPWFISSFCAEMYSTHFNHNIYAA